MGEISSSSIRFLVSLLLISIFLLMTSTKLLFRSDDVSVLHASVFEFDQVLLGSENYTNVTSTNSPHPSEIATLTRNYRLESESSEPIDSEEDIACDSNRARLRVYMYDMPSKFHFGLLGWAAKGDQMWPNVSDPGKIPPYPGGLNKQHSVEYWLTLDLLASDQRARVSSCTAFRVHNVSQADIVFVPFFSALSYNRHSRARSGENERLSVDKMLQKQLVEYLTGRAEWKRNRGKDHLLVPHHPNSMVYARKRLSSARFVLADFGRYSSKVANLGKDVIAPYKHVVRSVDPNASLTFEERPTLAFFQGAIQRKDGGSIRQELYKLMKDEKDVHFRSGSLAERSAARKTGQGMGSSKFCLSIAGDTPSSNRLFDAIVSHCVPVIISDEIELPYEDELDYSEFSVFVLSSDAVRPGFLAGLLRGIGKSEWVGMWTRLKEVARCFEYEFPSKEEDAVDMIWKAVARKVAKVTGRRRRRRYRRPDGVVEERLSHGSKYVG